MIEKVVTRFYKDCFAVFLVGKSDIAVVDFYQLDVDKVNTFIANHDFLVRFGGVSDNFGRTMIRMLAGCSLGKDQ